MGVHLNIDEHHPILVTEAFPELVFEFVDVFDAQPDMAVGLRQLDEIRQLILVENL
jgi:hypothetical protein